MNAYETRGLIVLQFIPRTECEEIILLLLIGEAMAVRDAVLSQSPEFESLRNHSYINATAVYDLLAVAAVRWGQICLIVEVRSIIFLIVMFRL